MDILFASKNRHKAEEAQAILGAAGIHIISLSDLHDEDDVLEDGLTFSENAYKKAVYYSQKYRMRVFADDSGLVIPALNNEPGVFSARYAGEHGNYRKNNILVLEKMKGIADRQAYFVTAISYIDCFGKAYSFEGRLQGRIAEAMHGENGFGYDPLFFIPELGKTLAEIPNEAKNSLSHRFFALSQLMNHLKEEVNSMENIVLEDVRKILKTNDVSIVHRLMGGMSNYTYVVKADNELYTYRIPGEFAEYFVDRHLEIANIQLAETLGITNKTLYLNPENGRKLATYVEGEPLSTFPVYPYAKVAELLKKIHQSGLQAQNDYQPYTRLALYEQYVRNLGYLHPEHYYQVRDEFLTYRPYLEKQKKVFTHGDSQPSNFILNQDHLMVVDFEFCANNDPLYDIACFANKSYEEGLQLLHVYFKNPAKDEILRFHLWRCFQCLQWYNVAIFKELRGLSLTLHVDFQKVAAHYLELAEMLLKKIKEID